MGGDTGLLTVTVKSGVKLPNVETGRESDPFVIMTFKGIQKKTNHIENTCNPSWNEKLSWDLEKAIEQNAQIEFEVKDYEKVGRNRLLGTGTLNLREVVRSQSGQVEMTIQLVDSNKRKIEGSVNFLVIYKPPGKKSGGDKSGGDTVDGEGDVSSGYASDGSEGLATDVEIAMGEEEMQARKAQKKSKSRTQLSDKPQDLQIRIKIYTARQLPGGDINSVCKVTMGKEQKSTKVKKNSSEPLWNETFFYNVHQSPQQLFDEMITFEVFNARNIRADALIGSYKLDVGSVYDQPQHAFLSKWMLLTDPEDSMSGCKGYLKFSALVLGPGDEPPKEKEAADTDDIEMNLLSPAGVQLQPATFWLKAYRAEDVPQMDTSTFQGIKKILGSNEERKELVDPYLGFYFAGKKVKTKVILESNQPEWNQELQLGIKFPSMCDKIKINMKDWDQMSKDDTIGTVFISLDSIQDRSSDAEGFLPTFGPCWVNFYGSTREYSDMPDQFEDLNEGKGEGCAYRGRALVEIGTILGETPEKHVHEVDPEDLFRLHPFVRRRRYVLFASLLEATMLCEDDDPVEFEISIGNYGNKLDETVPPQPSTSQPTNPVYDGAAYYFLPWQDKKPCLSVNCQWEDISFRLETLNFLLRIGDRLEEKLQMIHFAIKANASEQAQAKCVVDALDQLIEDTRIPLPAADSSLHAVNQLDKEMCDLRRKELKYVNESAFQLRESATDLEEAVNDIESYLDILRNLAQEPQNSMPDVIIWMISGSTRVAYYRMPAYDVLFSGRKWGGSKGTEQAWGKGRFCGKKQTIFLKFPGVNLDEEQQTKISAQIRTRIWLGLESESANFRDVFTDAEIETYAETYENQINLMGKWTTTGLTRPMFSDQHGLYKLQKEKFVAPKGYKWAGEWFVNPEISHSFDTDAHHVQFLEDIFENEERSPGGKWAPAHLHWTDVRNDMMPARDKVQCPEGWNWQEEWHIDLNRAVDDEGWEYCAEATQGNYGPSEKTYHLCRRRRWIRLRTRDQGKDAHELATRRGSIMPIESPHVPPQERKRQQAADEDWEYASMFTAKFHAKEKTMDLCRRRRWHRKLQSIEDGSQCIFVIDVESDEAKPVDEQMTLLETPDAQAEMSKRGKMGKICRITPRMFLSFKKERLYQLRAYIYQARGLLSADDDSFSDPFARIVFMNRSQSTEVIMKSICPTWDQTLIFENISIYDNPVELEENPPNICIELFDYDRFGSPEFMGRAVVKPIVKLTSANSKVARLQWVELHRLSDSDNCGELLCSFELFAYEGGDLPYLPEKRGNLFSVPTGIRPVLQRTAIEVLCWGVRNMKKYQLSNVNSPSIEFECGGNMLYSNVIKSVDKNPNFDQPVLFLDVLLPKEELYTPPMNIRCRDNRQFGRKPMVGMCSIKSLQAFKCEAPQKEVEEDRDSLAEQLKRDVLINIEQEETAKKSTFRSSLSLSRKKKKKKKELEAAAENEQHMKEEEIDWWCKFYVSSGNPEKAGSYPERGWDVIQVYDSELERVEGFAEFNDFVQSFPLERGKAMDEDDLDIVGEFKGSFRIYPLPNDPSFEMPPKIFKSLPSSTPQEVFVRVYIIRAMDLQPMDDGGAADPYIVIKCGKTKIIDQENYKPNTLNPVFGKVFELTTTVPISKDLRIQLYDYDMLSSDDLIGETRIDLENRFLTHFRATVGLPQTYCIEGINKWRDCMSPRQILDKVCVDRNLNEPMYLSDDVVCIRGIKDQEIFRLQEFEKGVKVNPDWGPPDERLALHVLRLLDLTPEHVETRPLFSDLQPGIEQGRLQMWVDMFPADWGPPGDPVDITPRVPKTYELRVVIWNTKEVILQDMSITGEEMVDIYVKGWLEGQDGDKQSTDIHYRSLDGEGNFNWRFVFRFDYLPQEKVLVVQEKDHFWSLDKTETQLPAQLCIQIWDNDLFSSDDYIGQINLPLEKLPLPAKTDRACKPIREFNPKTGEFKERKQTYVSLFNAKRTRGWWPCMTEETEAGVLAGKVEMEMEILLVNEAEESPAGKAREEPNANPTLEPPNRPETSFLWFTSPWKTLKYIIWKNYKWKIIGFLLLLLFILFLGLFLYSLPGAITQSMFN